jgi:hypothetical protein
VNRRRLTESVSAGLILCLSVLLVACGNSKVEELNQPVDNSSGEVSIADITSDPAGYEGRTVTVRGEYRGWETGYGPAPVTRSDWILKDETGAIYITGRVPPGLDPVDDRGTEITVYGVVKVKDNQVYIEAK